MGSVIVLAALAEFIVSIKKIPAMYIVHVTVSVIINAISRNLIFVGPDSILQIRMIDINSRVNDCHYHRPVLLCAGIVKVPCRQDINIHSPSCPDLLDTVSIRSGYRGRHAKVVCQINVGCQLRVAVLKAICDLAVLQLRIILQAPLISGIAV